MKDEIVFTDEFRKSMWSKFENLEMKIQFLKGIVRVFNNHGGVV